MIESLKARWIVIGITALIAVVWFLPNVVNLGEKWWFSKEKIIYGLDIQGGLQLVMQVDVKGVILEKTTRLAKGLGPALQQEGVTLKSSALNPANNEELILEYSSSDDLDKIKKHLDKYYPGTLQIVSESNNKLELRYYDTVIAEYKRQAVSQAIEVIRNRIDEFGVSEPSIIAQGEDRIMIQLPGIKDSERAKDLIHRTAHLSFMIVDQTKSRDELNQMVADAEKAGGYALSKDMNYSQYIKRLNADVKAKLPPDTEIAFEKLPNVANLEEGKAPYLVKTDGNLSGSELEDAYVSRDQYGKALVIFKLTIEGRRRFADLTEKNVGQQMAIVLDDVVQSAPSIRSKIDSDSAQIELGRGASKDVEAEAQMIATTLRAGALPAALEQLEERTVGPTLGADAILKGKRAGLVAAIIVSLFMIIFYRRLGLVADLALGFNIFLILAILTSLGATLTLPGVAGIILTIGMAVDANIIIYERIKEEFAKSSNQVVALKDGFGHAFSAILDSNLTTIAACIVLMYFGTGPVRGFAVTMTIGILTTMFCATFVTRSILEFMVQKMKVKQLVN